MKHELKTWPEYYEQVRNKTKPFEYRMNDRGFKVGDDLVLREWNNDIGAYTDRGEDEQIIARVTSILEGFGLPEGYAILGIPRIMVVKIERDHGKGMCKECKHRYARTDYNGHGHWVCDICDEILSDQFDEEYR